MKETAVGKAVAIAAPTIVLIIVVLFTLSYLVSNLLGLPLSLGPLLVVRITGSAMVIAGLGVVGWLFMYRTPADMVVSTYVTFTKLVKRTPIAELSGRTETLVVSGPQRYVRHPLYLSVVVITFGCALVAGYTFILVASFVVLLWFWLVLIPFEEKELLALFGDQYVRYTANVPMLVPFTKRARRSGPGQV